MATDPTNTRAARVPTRSTTARRRAPATTARPASRSRPPRRPLLRAAQRRQAHPVGPKTTARPARTELELASRLGQAQAERGVLIGVGAALIARDNVVDTVKPYPEPHDRGARAEEAPEELRHDLRKFERRGTTARNRLEREVKRTRTRVERQLRQRRTKAVATVKQYRRDVRKQVKAGAPRPQSLAEDRREAGHEPRLGPTLPPAPAERRDRGVRLAASYFRSLVQYLSSLSRRRPSGRGVGLFGADASAISSRLMPTREADPGRAPHGHRPRAAQEHRRPRHGALDRQPAEGRVDVVVSLTTPGCPIRAALREGRRPRLQAIDGVPTVTVDFDVLSDRGEAGLAQRPRPPGRAARGRAGRA